MKVMTNHELLYSSAEVISDDGNVWYPNIVKGEISFNFKKTCKYLFNILFNNIPYSITLDVK